MRTALAAAIFLLLPAFGADNAAKLDGDWSWKMPSPFGETTAVLTLKSEGDKLTGVFAFTETRKLNVENGRIIDGKTLKMTVKRDRPEGGSVAYELSAPWDGGDEIKGTAETDMFGQKSTINWTATRQRK